MSKAAKELSVYVVYPAALFDGWEVVKENDDKPVFFDTREKATFYAKARAAMDGGAVVKLENWSGDTENLSEVPPPTSDTSHNYVVSGSTWLFKPDLEPS